MAAEHRSEKNASLTVDVNSEVQNLSQASEEDNSSAFSDKSWKAIFVTCIPIALICLLVWLDEAILATAIPRISDEFKSFDQIGWYGPSYGSGVLAGSLTIFSEEIPKAKLPYVMGAFGWVHSIGAIAGPVFGGAITSSSLTWRWCFYLNPIISAVAMVPILFLWRGEFLPDSRGDRPSIKEVLVKFDYLGFLVFAAAVVALLLGLQFGGSRYSWSDKRTISSLAIASILFLAFAATEWWKGSDAILPALIIRKRVVWLSLISTATLDGAYFILVYQIPLWFRSISKLSARDSGLRILPLLASCIFGNMTGTTLIGKLRYYHPFMLLSAIMLTVGSGVLTTLSPRASPAKWVIFEILVGFGTGLGSPLPLLAVQDALQPSDVPIGYTVVLTAGYLGSSIALATAQAIFSSRLKHDIHLQLPGVDPNSIVNAGATELSNLIPSNLYQQGLQLFNMALTQSWYISVVLAGISIFPVLGYKWEKMDIRDKKSNLDLKG